MSNHSLSQFWNATQLAEHDVLRRTAIELDEARLPWLASIENLLQIGCGRSMHTYW